MNILFVTGEFPKNERDTVVGGMAYAVYKSALGMKKRGHRVRILAVSDNCIRWSYHGLEVVNVKVAYNRDDNNVLRALFGILRREYFIENSIKYLDEEEHIDIIQYTGWFGIGLFHRRNIPAVMRVSSYTKIQLSKNYSKKKSFMFECIDYLAAKRMNFVFAPSRIMAEGIQKDIGKKVAVIETPYYSEKINSNDVIIQTKLKNKRYILYFGRLSVDKGILVIKDVIYPILKKYEDLYFVFAGNSAIYNGKPIKDELIKGAGEYKNRVILLEWIQKEKLAPVINKSEFILMPSLADNLPNACAEAMAMGKIVIGTDGSSLEQFITNGKNGFLTRIGSSDDLIQCIEYVLKLSDEQKSKISQNAIERIKSFDLDMYSLKMENIYAKIIKLVEP